MPKSRAEIQKAYRERQKAKGPEFLEKEKQRSRQYYIPAANLGTRKRAERNNKTKLRNRLSRLRKKERLLQEQIDNEDTSGYASMDVGVLVSSEPEPEPGPSNSTRSSLERNHLVVKLPVKRYFNKGSGIKKTNKRALARARRTITNLENDLKDLRKKLKTKSKQIERLKSKVNNTNEMTPRKQTEKDLSKVTLTPQSKRKIKRKLLIGNAVLKEVSETKEVTKRKSRTLLHSVVSGRVTKKYRLLSEISKSTGLSRNSLLKCRFKKLEKSIEKRKSLTKLLENKVQSFLQREDNCRVRPGKADTKRDRHNFQQTCVLTDYLRNLHIKFLSENPDIKISFASFCRMRPKNVLLASFISRNACQCIRHQNMALKVQSLRKLGLKISSNPETLLNEMDQVNILCTELPDNITYKVWKKVPLENGVLKMKIVQEVKEKNDFWSMFNTELAEFSEHVERVKEQYRELRNLKEKLPQHELIVQMDFAENFSCRSLDEVQTAYWNQTAVTLHPVVAYFKKDGILKHKSFVVVSDETNHSAATVCAFLDVLIPKLKEIDPNLKKIHYWTDSPSSQYRNRFIFHTLANHENKYGLKGQWNYFEAGHGKGPCDGLGGITKRMADEAIRQGKAEIQDASEFFKWASASNMTEVSFLFVKKRKKSWVKF